MIEVVSSMLMLFGGLIALLAGVGLLRFRSSYARFHSAGKASPVAFVIAAVGAGLVLGGAGRVLLATAIAAIVLTLPVAVHLLFRAFHTASTNDTLLVDELSARRSPGR